MKRFCNYGLAAFAATLLFAAPRVFADDTDLAFTVEVSGDTNVPTVTITNNSPTLEFNQCVLLLGDLSKHFDGNTVSVTAPVGGTAAQVYPIAGIRSDYAHIVLSGFGPGKTFSFQVDIDMDSTTAPDTVEDFRSVFFNNGGTNNSAVTMYSGPRSVTLTLDDRSSGQPYKWRGPKQNLLVRSVAETNGSDYVRAVQVKVDDGILPERVEATRVGEDVTIQVPYGSDVEISTPRVVYRDINGADITDSVDIDPALIEQEAEERFSALGISVNDVAPTGDPTLYRFQMLEPSEVEAKWQQDYALTINSDFSGTLGSVAGPLTSQAAGNPSPPAQKQWVRRGEFRNVQIDGAVLDLNSPQGLDVRYVVKSYFGYGPANTSSTRTLDSDRLPGNDGGNLETSYPPKAVGSYDNTASPVKVNVTGHGFSTGMRVRITGASAAAYNDDFDITVLSANQFSIPVTAVAGATGGSVQRLVDIRESRSGSITTWASGGTGVSVITSAGHGLKNGAAVRVRNASNAVANAEWTVSGVTATTYRIPTAFVIGTTGGSWEETTYRREFPMPQPFDQRQQVDLLMDGPAGVTFKWEIQYGVRVNVDDVSRDLLPRIVEPASGNLLSSGQGVTWFDPGARLKIETAARDSDGNALSGWINGDGFYFPSVADVDTVSGALTGTTGAGSIWRGGDTNSSHRGLEITALDRPARVLWRYGPGAIAVQVTVGEFVFQNDPGLASTFTRQPSQVSPADFTINSAEFAVSGTTPASDDITIWDPVAGRLYPLLPGQFTVPWKPGTDDNNLPVDVRVTAVLPNDSRGIRGHYPHIAGAPPVALDPDPDDNFSFKQQKLSNNGATVDGNGLFTAGTAGKTVLLFSEIQREGRGQPREFLRVRVVHTLDYDSNLPANPTPVRVGNRITDTADRARLGTGWVRNSAGPVRYNPFLYDVNKLDGLAAKDIYNMDLLTPNQTDPAIRLTVVNRAALPGPIFAVNEHPGATTDEMLTVVWYDDPSLNDTLLWPFQVRRYAPSFPAATALDVDRIVIASQFGSESKAKSDNPNRTSAGEQVTAPTSGTEFPAATTFDPSRLQAVQVYQQPNSSAPGYNPNEEHALVAPSLRFADVSPRPPAIYALRNNDLNTTTGTGYTSKPFVLVQYFDTAIQDYRMKLYRVALEDANLGYTFANIPTGSPSVTTLNGLGHVEMEAGEPVIPFYPLGVAIGASVPEEIFGNNLSVTVPGGSALKQLTYWEDHKGTSWAVSGGDRAWFSTSFYYPLAPDFYWPANSLPVPKVTVSTTGSETTVTYGGSAVQPQTGDSVAFLPTNVSATPGSDTIDSHKPKPILYHSNWPENPPVLKAGETLTYSGGENRADNPTRQIVKPDGSVETVETPGLPQVLAFASAEVVFDSQNPTADSAGWLANWTGRVVQSLEAHHFSLPVADFSSELQPATGRTRVSEGKFIFNDLPASLQRRFRYDPILQQVEFQGVLNDRFIGSNDLTAAPPAVYVLEPNILNDGDIQILKALVTTDHKTEWDAAIEDLAELTRDPGQVTTEFLEDIHTGLAKNTANAAVPARAFGPGLALVPNDGLLNPNNTSPAEGWITVVENNDPSLGGSPITPHIIKVDRRLRYRGSIKTILSDNVFDENIVLRHTGDFGAEAKELRFEWWYRPDDGSLNVPPPDRIPAGQTNPWKLFPDPSGRQGEGRYEITLKGNPNAPETLLADTWWFCRYRHKNDAASGSNWSPNSTTPTGTRKYEWAGAGNNDPFHDFDLDGFPDYRAQLAMGWIKRVLDAVNPYEARIRDFEGDNPATVTSMISQFGPRFEGPVALNPAQNVIENVGLIELYETVLKRARDLSIDLSRPVSTPAIANALQLASTRISDFYTLLGNEAYSDSLDPTIGFASEPGNDLSGANPGYGSLAPAIFTFQNQMPNLISEELSLLRGVDDFFARPVYNRLFWNFTKDQGEAAYAVNYNISDVTMDGFVDEDDAMKLFPMGHGDSWGHYLTAVRKQYALLNHPFFNWVSRSESYNLQDIVITVDFYDERKFAATAAAKAKAGAEIVSLTYRDKYVESPDAQWQGYTDTNPDRAWGVDEWARRAGQGAYFDWITANALLPSEHPNTTLEGVRKVDRESNSDIPVVSANLSAIQMTMDNSNRGQNPLGLSRNALVFDIDPTFLEVGSTAQIGTRAVQGLLHFDQIYERALKMMENAQAIWNNANTARNMLRQVGNTEVEFRNATFQEDLSYRNQLIQIFGKPYQGTIGSGKLYPAGYEGPDLALYMYVPVRQLTRDTIPGPSTGTDALNSGFAAFNDSGELSNGDLFHALKNGADGGGLGTGTFPNDIADLSTANAESDARRLFNPTFAASSNYTYGASTTGGLFAVNYTDLQTPKVGLTNFIDQFPITAAGYTFQAPTAWGQRSAPGELQSLITQMLVQEAAIAEAVGAWDSLSGGIIRNIRFINARLTTTGRIQVSNEAFSRIRLAIEGIIKGIQTIREVNALTKEAVLEITNTALDGTPIVLPTGGLSVSPGDALFAARAGIRIVRTPAVVGFKSVDGIMKILEYVASTAITAAQNELDLWKQREERDLQIQEWLRELEDLIGDEPIRRITIFKEIQTLHDLSAQYRAKLDEGVRLIDERAAFNKRVAAQTQRQRYNDMTLRVTRNHALQTYRSQFDLAARYAWLAAKAYDYETNYDASDPGSPQAILSDIVRSRTIGLFDDQPRRGAGGLSDALATLKANYESQRGQLGLNTPQRETGKMSLRTQLMRILPKGSQQPQPDQAPGEFPSPGMASDDLWTAELNKARVADLWEVPEFRYYCRPFAPSADTTGRRVPQPGLVFRFGSEIMAGKNFFGRPLAGGDQAFDTTNYTTKIVGVGVWFSDYLSSDVLNDLAVAPRVYMIPAGADIMRVPHSANPDTVRVWNVLDQAIPVPLPALHSTINTTGFIPLLDTLNGPSGEVRKFSSFRAYHNGEADIDLEELVTDSRLIGRSVWNTEWILIVPGQALNADANAGLDRFIQQVSDISIVFETYGLSGG
jgi:hypothetical protein